MAIPGSVHSARTSPDGDTAAARQWPTDNRRSPIASLDAEWQPRPTRTRIFEQNVQPASVEGCQGGGDCSNQKPEHQENSASLDNAH